MNFCPGCGKELRRNEKFCLDCRPKQELKVRDIVIKICSSCNKYFHKNKWTKYKNLEKVIIRITRDNTKEDNLYIKPKLPEFRVKPGLKKKFNIEISKDDDLFIIPVEIQTTYCNNCRKKQGDYFEGVLQLRNLNDNILKYVDTYIEKYNVYISKRNETTGGINLRFSDKKKIQNLGHLLKKNYGGVLKISPKLHTRDKQTSKEVYRVNVYYKAPDYKKGDVIKIENKLILVSVVKKNITGIDLKLDKKITLEIEKKDYKILKPVKTTVSKIYPTLEVLDTETFQSVPVQNKKKVKQGEKVNIVSDNGLYYIF